MKIAKDKLLHMIDGAIVALIVLGIGYYNHVEFYGEYAVISSIAVGLAKEFIWDASHPATNTVDIFDAGATFAGGALAVAGWKFCYVLVMGGVA